MRCLSESISRMNAHADWVWRRRRALGSGADGDSDELPAAVAEDHQGAHHTGGLAAEIHGVAGQIHLSLLSLIGLKSQMRTAARSAADGADVFFEHAVAALVSERADLPQDASGREVFLHHQFGDDGLEGIQLR
jgi:hypothetical protein